MREEYLSCGVPFEEILDQVTEHRPPRDPAHQAGCPICRATLAELGDVWSSVDELAAEEVRAPAFVLRRVMDRIQELSRQPWYAVVSTAEGNTKIAARVIGALARLAAEDVPQVTLAMGGGRTGAQSSRAALAGSPGEAATDVGVAGSHVVLDVQVVVETGAHIPALADRIRGQIRGHIARTTGLTITEVNITVVDVVRV